VKIEKIIHTAYGDITAWYVSKEYARELELIECSTKTSILFKQGAFPNS
jgi:hypothetical protein